MCASVFKNAPLMLLRVFDDFPCTFKYMDGCLDDDDVDGIKVYFCVSVKTIGVCTKFFFRTF